MSALTPPRHVLPGRAAEVQAGNTIVTRGTLFRALAVDRVEGIRAQQLTECMVRLRAAMGPERALSVAQREDRVFMDYRAQILRTLVEVELVPPGEQVDGEVYEVEVMTPEQVSLEQEVHRFGYWKQRFSDPASFHSDDDD